MATGRILKTQISHSEQVNDLPLAAAFLFTWMIPHADDFGRLPGSARKIKAIVVPMKDEFNSQNVEVYLQEMHSKGLILLYFVNNERYIQMFKFESHQSGLHKRTKSKFPDPPETTTDTEKEDSGNFPEIPLRREEKRREEKRKEENILRENVLEVVDNSATIPGTNSKPKKKIKHDARHDQFYKLYPNKQDSKSSQKSFDKYDFSDDKFSEIMQSLQNQIDVFNENEKSGAWQPAWKLPATWLNKESWNNEVKIQTFTAKGAQGGARAWDLFFNTAVKSGWDSTRIIADGKTMAAVNKIGGVRTIGLTSEYQMHNLKKKFIEFYEATNE